MRYSVLVPLMLSLLVVDRGRAQSTTGTVMAGGVPLRYVREGSGPAAVAIGSATYYPKAYSADLRKQLEMIFVDSRHFVPGYRPAAAELAQLELQVFADDLDVVREQLGVQRWVVIGHSIHAQIAIAYARKYPARVSHLVIVGGVPFKGLEATVDSFFQADASAERKAVLRARTLGLDSVLAATAPARRFAIGYRHRSALYWADPEYDAAELLDGLESGPAFARLIATLPTRDEVRRALSEIEAPTLIVLGRLDYAVPYFEWESLVEGLPNVSLEILGKDSHNPQTEAPERFDPILVRFVMR